MTKEYGPPFSFTGGRIRVIEINIGDDVDLDLERDFNCDVPRLRRSRCRRSTARSCCRARREPGLDAQQRLDDEVLATLSRRLIGTATLSASTAGRANGSATPKQRTPMQDSSLSIA